MDIIERLRTMRIQGAREIAIESLRFLKSWTAKNGWGHAFDIKCAQLEAARPTAVVLHNCIQRLKQERSADAIDKLIAELENSKATVARVGRKIIRPGVIMTHCHSGEALGVIKAAKNKRISVIATETRPRLQGIKTAKELAASRIPVTLITDSAAGYFMPRTDLVLVGADALRREGVVNKIGTYMLALTAVAHRKPFYVAASSFKLDRRKKFVIEERPTTEIYHRLKGVRIRNPAFDLTPWPLVKAVITDKGIFKPREIVRILRG